MNNACVMLNLVSVKGFTLLNHDDFASIKAFWFNHSAACNRFNINHLKNNKFQQVSIRVGIWFGRRCSTRAARRTWRRGRDSTYPKFLKLLISGNISSDTHENRGFFAFCPVCPFRPVCPVEPISAFYGQDRQELLVDDLDIDSLHLALPAIYPIRWKR